MYYQNFIFKRYWPILIQTAEAHRKPRWLPVAKSKIYRIPKRPVIPIEERVEILRLHNNYRTQMRAIRLFYHNEMVKENSSLDSAYSERLQRLEDEEWARCVELNEKWNMQVAQEREERRKAQFQALQEYALNKMEIEDMKLKKQIENASADIRREKELSATFITVETLEDAIEQALANPTDYNFAIDLKGNVYKGRDSPIIPPKDDKASSVSA